MKRPEALLKTYRNSMEIQTGVARADPGSGPA